MNLGLDGHLFIPIFNRCYLVQYSHAASLNIELGISSSFTAARHGKHIISTVSMCGVLVKLLKLSGANGMPRLQPIAKGPMGPRWVKMDVWICLGCPPVILLGRTFHKISGHTSATITSAFCTAMLYSYGRVGRQALLSGCSIPTELNS